MCSDRTMSAVCGMRAVAFSLGLSLTVRFARIVPVGLAGLLTAPFRKSTIPVT